MLEINRSAFLKINHDSKTGQINFLESSHAPNIALVDNRKGIDRRSGKDRRCHYNEKRKMIRSVLPSGTFAVLKRPRIFSLLGMEKIPFAMVLDISTMGLGAHYVASDIFNYKQNLLCITTNDRMIDIDDIPFKVITDYQIAQLPNNTQLRRCGIKFENVSDRHKLLINHLIEKYSFNNDSLQDL